jgi:ABC-2 type transport system permease protein
MTFLKELQLYYIRKVKEALRNPSFLMMSIMTPLLYLLLFAPLLKDFTGMPGFGGSDMLNVFLPGMIVVIAVYGGLYVGFGLVDEIRQGIIERFRVSPASRLALLLCSVLRDVSAVLVQAVLITLLALPFGLKVYWAGFLVMMLLLVLVTALFAAFSYVLALRLKSEDAIAPILQGVSMPLTLLAGFLLPMSMGPHWLQVAAYFDPVYYAVEGARALMNGQPNAAVVYQAFAVMIPVTALVFWWTIRSYRTVVS